MVVSQRHLRQHWCRPSTRRCRYSVLTARRPGPDRCRCRVRHLAPTKLGGLAAMIPSGNDHRASDSPNTINGRCWLLRSAVRRVMFSLFIHNKSVGSRSYCTIYPSWPNGDFNCICNTSAVLYQITVHATAVTNLLYLAVVRCDLCYVNHGFLSTFHGCVTIRDVIKNLM